MLKFTPERFAEHLTQLLELQNDAQWARGERDIRIVTKADELARIELEKWRNLVVTELPSAEEGGKPVKLSLTKLRELVAAEGEILYGMHERQMLDVSSNWTQLLRDRLPVTPDRFARLRAYQQVESLVNRF